ncbi:MAG TPA: lipopolysaccharide kinase InaA family protein [Gemmatimonadaceae bacterium]|nr:lipopolysaccharide kinase InaA family protein [Gemmatimonadaceae bacterium]
MSAGRDGTPAGFVRVGVAPREAIVREREADDVRAILAAATTLHDWASRLSGVNRYTGRAPAYGVALPGSGTRVVVRHARHGGVLAPLTRDLFAGAGRAPHELATSARLAAARVPTPAFVGYAVYPAGFGLSRIDVLVEEVPGARDLANVVRDGGMTPPLIEATAQLLAALARAGARHEDLNLKNVLISRRAMPDGDAGEPAAYAIDVDRVTFGHPRVRTMEANVARLARSARKWRRGRGLPIGEEHLALLARRARELAA